MFRMGKSKKLISLLFLAGFLSIPIPSSSAGRMKMDEKQIMQIAEKIGEKYNICPEFLTAIAFRESGYNPDVEYEGCIGLMQISQKWHKDRMERLGVRDLKEPYGNMLVAGDYLLELFEKYEDIGMVLQVYNGDSDAIAYWDGETGMSEYADYIIKMSEELEVKYNNKGE